MSLMLAKLRSKLGVAVAAFAAGILVAGGMAYAAIPDNQHVIHGCYDHNGQLRVIDSPKKKCDKRETAISWNQTGPQGPVGPSGSSALTCIACHTRDVLSRLGKPNLLNARLDFANLYGTEIIAQDFSGSSLVNAVLYGVQANGANFTDANLSDANMNAGFGDANFTRANLTGADFMNANIGGATMTDANLSGVIWNNTRCPDTTNSNDNGGTCIGHLVP